MSFSPLKLFPGLLACALVAAISVFIGRYEHILEPLVLAILIGAGIRTVWTPGAVFAKGIQFSAKTLLEIAVAFLGASISAAMILDEGPAMIAAVAALVPVVIILSYGIARLLGLSPRIATLTACGNAICGNSAIAAVAPVIGATGAEVASSIAFTAILSVAVVLILPLAMPVLNLNALPYGTLAGLTVYAVPQVLAAAAAGGAAAVQVGTLVKLIRVLMLGPVVFVLALMHRAQGGKTRLSQFVPWFIVAFLILMALRSLGVIPGMLLAWMQTTSTLLTVMAMAALGLQCDLKAVAQAGPRVSIAVTLSLLVLSALAYALIRVLAIG